MRSAALILAAALAVASPAIAQDRDPAQRQTLIDLAPTTWGDTPDQKAISLLLFALATPYYGVIR